METTKKVSMFKVLNLLNEKYDMYPFEITSVDEARDFAHTYFLPSANILSNIEELDAEIVLGIMNYWNSKEELDEHVIPLIVKSSLMNYL